MTCALNPALPFASSQEELLHLIFDGNYERIHKDVREVLTDPVFDYRSNLTLAEAGRLAYTRSRLVHGRLERPLEILKNPLRLFALAEWPSLLDISTFSLLMVHYNLCLGTVFDHGSTREDLADDLEELNSLASFCSYMATELGFGNNVAALRTEAVYDHSRQVFILNTPDPLAQKYMSYSGFTDISRMAVVMAKLKVEGKDCGVFPFIVRISDKDGLRPGIRTAMCPEKPAQGLDNGLTWFDHVVLPRRALLMGDMGRISDEGRFEPTIANSRKRFLRAMTRILPGRLCVASSAVGMGRASVYIALRYAQNRLTNAPGRNDMPVIEYRSHQLALFTCLAKVYAITLLVNHAKREFLASSESVSPDLNNLIALAKVLATWEMSDVATVCRERCGAQGMFSVNRMNDYIQLLQGLVTAEGDSQVLLATTAGQILSQEKPGNTVEPPAPEGRNMLDAGWLLMLLRFRERKLWSMNREAMDRQSDAGYLQAWNGVMNPALAAARLRGVATALQCLHTAAQSAQEPGVRTALGLMASLYGLTEIQRDSGWYLAQSALTAAQVLDTPTLIDDLCVSLQPHAPMLLEGFALTPELLRAPIAYDDYAAAFCREASVSAGTKPAAAHA
ncbi:MAG TPA: acyl-CoA dehydrogenase [Candidatus Angelobacter sp.]|nr:acyl-CoA dehydrogenase [Candidatus Angelobacter sp.]